MSLRMTVDETDAASDLESEALENFDMDMSVEELVGELRALAEDLRDELYPNVDPIEAYIKLRLPYIKDELQEAGREDLRFADAREAAEIYLGEYGTREEKDMANDMLFGRRSYPEEVVAAMLIEREISY